MKKLERFIDDTQEWLEDGFPWTLVPCLLWVLFAWPLYLAVCLWPGE
jgi:hypothetical protein